jgi:hypothetical protein
MENPPGRFGGGLEVTALATPGPSPRRPDVGVQAQVFVMRTMDSFFGRTRLVGASAGLHIHTMIRVAASMALIGPLYFLCRHEGSVLGSLRSPAS